MAIPNSASFEISLSPRDAELFYQPVKISTGKVTPMASNTKKYRANVSIYNNENDRGSLTVQTLLSVELYADTFADLVAQAHGHLELAKDN